MLEKFLTAFVIVVMTLIGCFIGQSLLKLNDLETRVIVLEESSASWDITIVRPTAE